ncbi:type I-B CRISPR-associated protein Cas7/Cst2/DevR [Candidatus Parcubacteria bacterium]|nr:MAG: type I-B CRISPR-associated protein Cas7/Cst2/DevR [Candidatus Parcubacteria bacterium]
MSFVTGLLLIDAPASALNNLGNIPGARTDNTVGVKLIRARDGAYPYVSAQSFRYWLRTTLEKADLGWKKAPIFREKKVAYTDANPILYWDDDLFGYMRAPSKKTDAVQARETDESRATETLTTDTVTRVSPFRVSTLVSIAPVTPTDDFGTMSRHEGDPVPHEHQFYRTTLKGLFSLDLHACGTFSYRNKTGFRNLDDVRIKLAEEKGLESVQEDKSYRLPLDERIRRISALFEGMAHLEGGAKQTLHYTDVSPDVVIMAVTKGGNHIFGHVVGATGRGLPTLKLDALAEALTVFQDDILSDVYVGWVKGYLDEERAAFEAALAGDGPLTAFADRIRLSHPREAFRTFVSDLQKPENESWLV